MRFSLRQLLSMTLMLEGVIMGSTFPNSPWWHVTRGIFSAPRRQDVSLSSSREPGTTNQILPPLGPWRSPKSVTLLSSAGEELHLQSPALGRAVSRRGPFIRNKIGLSPSSSISSTDVWRLPREKDISLRGHGNSYRSWCTKMDEICFR